MNTYFPEKMQTQQYPNKRFSAFSLSVQGAAHEDNDIPLQDASGHRFGKNYAIVAVADGHGGAQYIRSNFGSQFAVKSALDCLTNFLIESKECIFLKDASQRDIEKSLRQLEGAIIYNWRDIVDSNFNQLTNDELSTLSKLGIQFNTSYKYTLYGTTLIYSCLIDGFCFVSQIGDGQVAFIDTDGNIVYPIQDDERLMCGLTTSLCSDEAANDFRRTFKKNSISSIVIATDGVSDSYSRNSYKKFVQSIAENFSKRPFETEEAIRQWLPTLSERGSRDDMSIGCVCITNI